MDGMLTVLVAAVVVMIGLPLIVALSDMMTGD